MTPEPGTEPPDSSSRVDIGPFLFEDVPSRAVRILRAKVGELEHIVRIHYEVAERTHQDVTFEVNLAADIALVADILAQFIEWAGEWSERDA
jgi:hypothetical protein